MRLKLLIFAVGIGSALAQTGAVRVTTIALPQLPLGLVTLPGGKGLNLTVSPAAGAYRGPEDDSRRIWTISDRGPSHDCTGKTDAGERDRTICAAGKLGRVFLLPGYSPSIYAVELGETAARYLEMVTLRGASGRPLTGIPAPHPEGRGEDAFAADGRALEPDPSGIDPGALVRLRNGTFIIAEGYGPSLVEVAPDGVVRRRIVPKPLGTALAGADYPIEASLPAALMRRRFGRGFDGLALSQDEAHLFVALQGPLPGKDGAPGSAMVRIVKVDRRTGQVAAQFAYRPDPLGTDSDAVAAGAPHEPRLVEIATVGDNRLVVLERNRGLSRIYCVNLADAQPLPEEPEGAEPGLEQVAETDWPQRGIVPLGKRLVFSNADAPALAGRLHGMAVLSDRELLITTSREYGVEGGKSQMFRLTFPAPITN